MTTLLAHKERKLQYLKDELAKHNENRMKFSWVNQQFLIDTITEVIMKLEIQIETLKVEQK